MFVRYSDYPILSTVAVISGNGNVLTFSSSVIENLSRSISVIVHRHFNEFVNYVIIINPI